MANGPCTCFFDVIPAIVDTEPKFYHGLAQTLYSVASHNIALHAECPLTIGDMMPEDDRMLDRTGLLLWPGSTAMTHALLKLGDRGLLASRSVLELGCGLGLCGLIASLYTGGPVILTDKTGTTRAAARENIRCNQHLRNPATGGCLAEVRKLDWLSSPSIDETGSLCFDLVIASDVLYVDEPRFGGLEMDDLQQFFGTISRKLAPGGMFLLSYANRENGEESIKEAANQHGLLCCKLPLCNFVSHDILHAYGATSLAYSMMLSFALVKDASYSQLGDSFSSAVITTLTEEMALSMT